MDAAYSPLTTPPLTPFTFTGREFDSESGLYHYRARTYSPSLGRFLSRDPLEYVDGMNLYEYVRSTPCMSTDPDGREEKKVACGGTCGAVIDDWITDEIKAQKNGWDKWKKDNPSKTKIEDYIPWANGNQRYKDPKFFKFNAGTPCGTKAEGAEVGCGFSVTLCGKCVRSAILGNIMYGLIGNYAGFTDKDLRTADDWKNKIGIEVDKYDAQAYKLGEDLDGTTDFCVKFVELVDKNPAALYEGRKDGGYNDLSTCAPCTEKTKATNHGGNEKPRLRP
jgi:RHS repeat-associated protein